MGEQGWVEVKQGEDGCWEESQQSREEEEEEVKLVCNYFLTLLNQRGRQGCQPPVGA